MKWFIFSLTLLLIYPAVRALRRHPEWWVFMAFFVGALPFVGLEHFDINILSNELYRGDTRGFEITLLDLLATALWFALPRRPGPSLFWRSRVLYLIAACASVLVAQVPLLSLFGVWKLLRMYLLFEVVVRLAAHPKRAMALLEGLGAGLVYQATLCLWQRYGLGVFQAQGSLPHPNSLAMIANLIGAVALSLALTPGSRITAPLTVLTSWLLLLLSLSRASIALGAGATLLLFLLAFGGSRSPRERLGMLCAVVLLAGVALRARSTLVERFVEAPAQSADARDRFNDAAQRMLEQHPLGIGLNQFSRVLSEDGYAENAGLAKIDRDGIVHNIYWLTAAETGYLGLAAYVGLLAAPLLAALRGARRAGRGTRRALLAGCAVGLTITYAQGTLEWSLRQTALSYVFWIVAALIAAMCPTRPSLDETSVSS